MSIVQVQSVISTTATTSVPVSIAATGSGNLLVVMCSSTSSTITGITDNMGESYINATAITAENFSGAFVNLWYKANCSSGVNLVTITLDNTLSGIVVVQEYSGIYPISPLTFSGAVGTSNSISATAIETSGPPSHLAIGLVAINSQTISSVSNTSGDPSIEDADDGTHSIVHTTNTTGNAQFIWNLTGTAGSANGIATFFPDSLPTFPWADTGVLDVARANGSVVKLTTGPNIGKLLAVGGFRFSPTTGYTSCSLYDAVAKTWSATGSLNVAHGLNPTVLLDDGTPLTIAGITSSGGLTSTCELYDPVAGTWSTTGSLNVARYAHSAILLNDGTVLSGGGLDTGTGLFSWEIYDPIAKTWSLTGSTVSARSYIQLFKLSDGTVLAAGGYGDPGMPSTCEIYDPIAKTWSLTGSLSQGRYKYGTVVLSDGTFLIAGGLNTSNVLTSETFDPTTKLWTLRGSTTNYYNTPCCNNLLEDGNGDFYIIGGGSSYNLAEKYDISTHTWSDSGGSLGNFKLGAFIGEDSNGFIIAAGGNNSAVNTVYSDSVYGPLPVTLTLSLSDSISLIDSLSPSFDISQNLSDSVVVSDTAPNSFSIQSDFIAPTHIPVVEQLVNQLIPAATKTYFRIEE